MERLQGLVASCTSSRFVSLEQDQKLLGAAWKINTGMYSDKTLIRLGCFSGALFKDECNFPDHQFAELILDETDDNPKRRTVRSLLSCQCGSTTAVDLKRAGKGIFIENTQTAFDTQLYFEAKIKKAMPFLDGLFLCPWCSAEDPLIAEIFELENKLDLNPALAPPEETPALHYQALGIYRRYTKIINAFLESEKAEMERQRIKDLQKKPKKTINGFIT